MIIKRQKEFVSASYKNHKQKKEAEGRKKNNLKNKRSKSLERVYKNIESQKPVINPEVEKNIISSRKDTEVFRDPGKRLGDPFREKDDYSAVVPKELLEEEKKFLEYEKNSLLDKEKESEKEINRVLDSGKTKFIRYGLDSGIDTLSHEFGHLKNSDNKYPKENLEDFTDRDVLKDERQASRNAVGILKKAGASRKEIKQSKNNLRDNFKTYKLKNKGAERKEKSNGEFW